MNPRRFPSGIWLEITSSQNNANDSPEIGRLNDLGSPFMGTQKRKDSDERRSSALVSFLHSNLLNLGESLCVFSELFYFVMGAGDVLNNT